MEKVYVILAHTEWEMATASSTCVGVTTSFAKAMHIMQQEYKILKRNWHADAEDSDFYKSNCTISLFNTANNIDLIRVTIEEMKVEK